MTARPAPATSRSTSATARSAGAPSSARPASPNQGCSRRSLIVEVEGSSAILLSVGLTQSAHIEIPSSQQGVILPRAALVPLPRLAMGLCPNRAQRPSSGDWFPNPVPQENGFFVAGGFVQGEGGCRAGRGRAVRVGTERLCRGTLGMMGAVVRWSLERPRLIAWASLWFVALGLFYVRDIPFDLVPNLAPAETTIQTEAPGLVAEQVEDLVTRPIENALVGAAGVAQVHSESGQGLSLITLPLRRWRRPLPGAAGGQRRADRARRGPCPRSTAAPRGTHALTSQGAQVIADRLHEQPARSDGAARSRAMDRAAEAADGRRGRAGFGLWRQDPPH